MRIVRKWLILSHRYLGIALCLLLVMWFGSGIVMIYAGGMPALTPEARRAHLPALDFTRVTLSAADAAARAGLDTPPSATLLPVQGRPAYRFGGRTPVTVFADTGETMAPVPVAETRRIASRFLGVPVSLLVDAGQLTTPDQWTLQLARRGGLQKFTVDDDAATEVYVNPRTAEVVLTTTRRDRTLAWIGVIPHWMYFSWLRTNQPVWYRTVVWTSGAACVLALLGLVLGLTQWRRTQPFRLSAAVPYAGWMRWHYITGAVFGVFALTWAFSGLLSMEPFEWTNASGLEVDGEAFTGGPIELSQFTRGDAAAWSSVADGRPVKEVELTRIQDQAYYVVHLDTPPRKLRAERLHQPYYITGRAERDRLLVAADTMRVREEPFSVSSLMARLQTALPGETVIEQTLLTEYDSYYYSRGRQTPLPVLRVKYADAAQTWIYVDPEMSRVLGSVPKLARVERWLYNGLHSLDFSFWYSRRPLWDIGMIVLLLGGLASSAIGTFLGVRRIVRATGRTAAGLVADRAVTAGSAERASRA
ncbi:MAG TPA: PepSY domain-containing protein [Vicinamibacterales bacterium]|jgi:hypothetical protein|nr:PepSY domain-containing protein [Vicinamibacterales bacterium]